MAQARSLTDDVSARATARYIKTSTQKLGIVAALIRDKQAEHALDMLRFCPKKVAYDVRKTLESAIANAENNLGLDVDTLFVTEVEVGKAFTLKRFAARGRGRSSRIEKPYSRLTVVVRQLQPLPDIAEQE